MDFGICSWKSPERVLLKTSTTPLRWELSSEDAHEEFHHSSKQKRKRNKEKTQEYLKKKYLDAFVF